MLLTCDSVFITLATMWCLVQNSAGSSCPDGYSLNYTLPMFEKCKAKLINGTEVQLIPKLMPRRFAAKNCYGRRHDGIPPGYRVCRIPDCLKKPCQNGWCQEEMTNYSCHCLPDFTGINCESKIPITEAPETMLPSFSRKSENLTTVAASTQLKNVTGITDLGTTPAAFTPTFTKRDEQTENLTTVEASTQLENVTGITGNLTTVGASTLLKNVTGITDLGTTPAAFTPTYTKRDEQTENLTTVEASTQLKNVTGMTELGTTQAAFTPTYTKRDEQTGIPTTEASLSTSSSRQETSGNITTLASFYQVNNKTGITNCNSNPCRNGGLCTETEEGYHCNCTTAFYGHTCSCAVIHTPDVDNTRQYTFPGLDVAPGVTSFDFEVSANNDVHIGLSSSDAQERFMYEIAIGGWENIGGGIRRCVYQWESPCDFKTLHKPDPAVTLSGIPSYDHYQISFVEGNIRLYRYDSQLLLMEFSDSDPLEVSYVGIWTGFGSKGYWKFPSFCS